MADPEGWLRHDQELQSWTAVENGPPIGQVTLTRSKPDDDTARVWHEHTGGDINHLAIPVRLFIDPHSRRVGAGRLLMTAALDYARKQGLSVAFDVMLKDRAAIHLYERLGARQIADTNHTFGDSLADPAAVCTAA